MASSEGYITMEDGVRLFFRKAGNGPKTLVVLNGFALSFPRWRRRVDPRQLWQTTWQNWPLSNRDLSAWLQ